jgi:hypothetical protein
MFPCHPWSLRRMPFPVFTSITKSSFQLAYEAISLCHVNIPLSIIINLFVFLLRQMESAHQFLNQKHIRAVEEPWRRSSRNEALGQMLVTNQRLDQLAAAQTEFRSCGMLQGTCLSNTLQVLGRFSTTNFSGVILKNFELSSSNCC